mmetsp:Transcript_97285/g.209742  ORF Transcript_97285/g.209742 Transcript_97285/m.209742 type:complete len:604 (-) Transcript_97285:304-2115(-)
MVCQVTARLPGYRRLARRPVDGVLRPAGGVRAVVPLVRVAVEFLEVEVALRRRHVLVLGIVGVLLAEQGAGLLDPQGARVGVVDAVPEGQADPLVRERVVLARAPSEELVVVVDVQELVEIDLASLLEVVGAGPRARRHARAPPPGLARRAPVVLPVEVLQRARAGQAVPDALRVGRREVRIGEVTQLVASDKVAILLEHLAAVPGPGAPPDVEREAHAKFHAGVEERLRRPHLDLVARYLRDPELARRGDDHLVVQVPHDPRQVCHVDVGGLVRHVREGAVDVEGLERGSARGLHLRGVVERHLVAGHAHRVVLVDLRAGHRAPGDIGEVLAACAEALPALAAALLVALRADGRGRGRGRGRGSGAVAGLARVGTLRAIAALLGNALVGARCAVAALVGAALTAADVGLLVAPGGAGVAVFAAGGVVSVVSVVVLGAGVAAGGILAVWWHWRGLWLWRGRRCRGLWRWRGRWHSRRWRGLWRRRGRACAAGEVEAVCVGAAQACHKERCAAGAGRTLCTGGCGIGAGAVRSAGVGAAGVDAAVVGIPWTGSAVVSAGAVVAAGVAAAGVVAAGVAAAGIVAAGIVAAGVAAAGVVVAGVVDS